VLKRCSAPKHHKTWQTAISTNISRCCRFKGFTFLKGETFFGKWRLSENVIRFPKSREIAIRTKVEEGRIRFTAPAMLWKPYSGNFNLSAKAIKNMFLQYSLFDQKK
jgi:hypothetical protein